MKVKPFLFIVLSFLISISEISCENEEVLPNFTHEYYVRASLNPWGDAASEDEQIKKDVIHYLYENKINVKVIATEQILVQFPCMEDACLIGKTVKISVSKKGSAKLRELDDGWQRAR